MMRTTRRSIWRAMAIRFRPSDLIRPDAQRLNGVSLARPRHLFWMAQEKSYSNLPDPWLGQIMKTGFYQHLAKHWDRNEHNQKERGHVWPLSYVISKLKFEPKGLGLEAQDQRHTQCVVGVFAAIRWIRIVFCAIADAC